MIEQNGDSARIGQMSTITSKCRFISGTTTMKTTPPSTFEYIPWGVTTLKKGFRFYHQRDHWSIDYLQHGISNGSQWKILHTRTPPRDNFARGIIDIVVKAMAVYYMWISNSLSLSVSFSFHHSSSVSALWPQNSCKKKVKKEQKDDSSLTGIILSRDKGRERERRRRWSSNRATHQWSKWLP